MRNLSIRKFLSNKIGWLYLLSGGLLLSISLLGLFYSSVSVPIPTILHIILDKMIHISLLDEVAKNEEMIIWNIRLPRILTCLLCRGIPCISWCCLSRSFTQPTGRSLYDWGIIRSFFRSGSCFIF